MRNPAPCDSCGLEYGAFRTGLDFGTVSRMMRVGGTDASQWRHVHRRGVLGFWRGLKLQWFAQHLGECAPESVPF